MIGATRARHGDTYEVRTAWNRRGFVHRAPTRRSVKRALHLGLRRAFVFSGCRV
jgi:hypothetical protein